MIAHRAHSTRGFVCAVVCLVSALTFALGSPALAQEEGMEEMSGFDAGAGAEMEEEQGAEPPPVEALAQAMSGPGELAPEQRGLASWVGTWAMEGKSWGIPGAPPITFSGTSTRRLILGGRVLVQDVQAEFMGQPFEGRLTVGYDGRTGQHWSVWLDTISSGPAFSHGECSDDGSSCVLHGATFDPMAGTPVQVMDVVTMKSPTEQWLESYRFDLDGEKRKVVEVRYTRR